MGAPNNYMVCNGSNTGFDNDVHQGGQQNGYFNRHAKVDIASITYGTSNTILASELITTDQGGIAGSQTELSRVREGQAVKAEYTNPRSTTQVGAAITLANVNTWGTACAAITNINGTALAINGSTVSPVERRTTRC